MTGAVGERDVPRRTVSTGRDMWSSQTSWADNEERILTGAQVRELPKGEALVLKASAPAVIVEGKELDSPARLPSRPWARICSGPLARGAAGLEQVRQRLRRAALRRAQGTAGTTTAQAETIAGRIGSRHLPVVVLGGRERAGFRKERLDAITSPGTERAP